MFLLRRLPGILYTHRYTVYSTILLLLTLLYVLYRWNLICSNIEAWHHIRKACDMFDNGFAVGTLCTPLCVTKDINSVTCFSFHTTKEAVFSAEIHDTRLIFKSASTDVQSFHWYDNGVLKYPNEMEFLSTIRAIVINKLNLTLSNDLSVRLTHLKSTPEEINSYKRHKEMDNLWILLQDNEYLIATVYSDKDVFPQVLGTCGPYFAMEYMEPIQGFSALMALSDSREFWGRRVKAAVLIMDLLEELETGFREPFHLCDVKLDHFGITSSETKAKFLDLDGVYPKSIINNIIQETTNCASDDDCEFFDCRAKCDKETGKCHHFVTNNNLQVVCEKIFVGWRMSNTILIPGLLISEYTPSALATVLRQCSNPRSEVGKPRAIPDEEVKKRLYNILVEIDQSINGDFFV